MYEIVTLPIFILEQSYDEKIMTENYGHLDQQN